MKKENERYERSPTVYDRDPAVFTEKVRIAERLKDTRFTEIRQWIFENLEVDFDLDLGHFWFENKEDAVLFKLVWG